MALPLALLLHPIMAALCMESGVCQLFSTSRRFPWIGRRKNKPFWKRVCPIDACNMCNQHHVRQDEMTFVPLNTCRYASESNIIRYAKIAVQLKNKTVRDVALRCRWMTKKDISKRRKEDFKARKCKDRKDKLSDSSVKPSRLSIQSGLSQTPVFVSNCNDDSVTYNDIGGATRQLLQQNAWAFKQISANLAAHQIHENVGLLSQARENIFKILTNLNEMGPTMKKLPPLPEVNEELASSILPPTRTFRIQL